MGFGEAVSTCFSKYVDFEGRATRSEYWFFQLFVWLIFIVLLSICFFVVQALFHESLFHDPSPAAYAERVVVALLPFLFGLGVFLPNLAVHVRRLHDINMSGFFILLGLIPLGGLALLIMACLPSSEGTNAYGPAM